MHRRVLIPYPSRSAVTATLECPGAGLSDPAWAETAFGPRIPRLR